jgi:hypothetical protein
MFNWLKRLFAPTVRVRATYEPMPEEQARKVAAQINAAFAKMDEAFAEADKAWAESICARAEERARTEKRD